MQNLQRFFMSGDIRSAIAYMRAHSEFAPYLPAYTALFEEEQYRDYDLPETLNAILRAYQVYFRDVFYCRMEEKKASDLLRDRLCVLLSLSGADEEMLTGRLHGLFAEAGWNTQFGRTMGHYGPYIWKETVPVTYSVELPESTADYTVNILRGFLFRGWMDYLTFGQFGTNGWASPDGTINCIEKAYDFNSERFRVSLLKHEAQHTVDIRCFPGISPTELEYRAKLVELHYSADPNLLAKFLSEADATDPGNSHALASARIRSCFEDCTRADIMSVQKRALDLFNENTRELRILYPKDESSARTV